MILNPPYNMYIELMRIPSPELMRIGTRTTTAVWGNSIGLSLEACIYCQRHVKNVHTFYPMRLMFGGATYEGGPPGVRFI